MSYQTVGEPGHFFQVRDCGEWPVGLAICQYGAGLGWAYPGKGFQVLLGGRVEVNRCPQFTLGRLTAAPPFSRDQNHGAGRRNRGVEGGLNLVSRSLVDRPAAGPDPGGVTEPHPGLQGGQQPWSDTRDLVQLAEGEKTAQFGSAPDDDLGQARAQPRNPGQVRGGGRVQIDRLSLADRAAGPGGPGAVLGDVTRPRAGEQRERAGRIGRAEGDQADAVPKEGDGEEDAEGKTFSALHAAKMITKRRDEVTRLPQRGSSFRYSTFRASRITPTITSPTDFRVSAASLSMVSSTVCHAR